MTLQRGNPILDVEAEPLELLDLIITANGFGIVDGPIERPVFAQKFP